MSKFAMRDLLIDADVRFVVTDKGSTWVTDRFVMVRGDLFKKVPASRLPGWRKDELPVSRLRAVLAAARGNGKALTPTKVACTISGNRSLVWLAGGALICLNERVTRTYFLAGLRPRYLPEQNTVAWYGIKRGREVLMAVQKPVAPHGLAVEQIEAAA